MMKSMEEYINSVYAKYEETESKHQKYKTVRMKPYNPMAKVYGIATCLMLACVAFIGLKTFKPVEDDIIDNYVSTEKNDNNEVTYTKYLYTNSNFEDRIGDIILNSDLIAIVSNSQVTNYVYEEKNSRDYLKTIGTVTVEKIIKSLDENFEKDIITYSKMGGRISFYELEKFENIDWEKWEIDKIGHIIPQDEKTTTYYQQTSAKGCNFEKNKQYLAFLIYNEGKQIYEIIDTTYGIMEYDPETNLVKNIDTGEFEEFDWSLIK